MRTIIFGALMLISLFGGLWLTDLIGNPDISKLERVLGSFLAVFLGFAACVGIGMLYDADKIDRLRRHLGSGP